MLILKGVPPRRKRGRLYVAEDLSKIVRELARQERRTPSGLLLLAVKTWLEKERPQWPLTEKDDDDD